MLQKLELTELQKADIAIIQEAIINLPKTPTNTNIHNEKDSISYQLKKIQDQELSIDDELTHPITQLYSAVETLYSQLFAQMILDLGGTVEKVATVNSFVSMLSSINPWAEKKDTKDIFSDKENHDLDTISKADFIIRLNEALKCLPSSKNERGMLKANVFIFTTRIIPTYQGVIEAEVKSKEAAFLLKCSESLGMVKAQYDEDIESVEKLLNSAVALFPLVEKLTRIKETVNAASGTDEQKVDCIKSAIIELHGIEQSASIITKKSKTPSSSLSSSAFLEPFSSDSNSDSGTEVLSQATGILHLAKTNFESVVNQIEAIEKLIPDLTNVDKYVLRELRSDIDAIVKLISQAESIKKQEQSHPFDYTTKTFELDKIKDQLTAQKSNLATAIYLKENERKVAVAQAQAAINTKLSELKSFKEAIAPNPNYAAKVNLVELEEKIQAEETNKEGLNNFQTTALANQQILAIQRLEALKTNAVQAINASLTSKRPVCRTKLDELKTLKSNSLKNVAAFQIDPTIETRLKAFENLVPDDYGLLSYKEAGLSALDEQLEKLDKQAMDYTTELRIRSAKTDPKNETQIINEFIEEIQKAIASRQAEITNFNADKANKTKIKDNEDPSLRILKELLTAIVNKRNAYVNIADLNENPVLFINSFLTLMTATLTDDKTKQLTQLGWWNNLLNFLDYVLQSLQGLIEQKKEEKPPYTGRFFASASPLEMQVVSAAENAYTSLYELVKPQVNALPTDTQNAAS